MSDSQSLGCVGILSQLIFQWSHHESKRGPEFMADIRKERRLGAIEFRQRLSALSFLLISSGVRNSRGEVAGNQIKKTAIVSVYDSPGAEPCYQKAPELACGLNRHDNS